LTPPDPFLGGLYQSASCIKITYPQWNTHYQSFPATYVQANEFTSSTLSGHPESSHAQNWTWVVHEVPSFAQSSVEWV
jgi:hypothetical protein